MQKQVDALGEASVSAHTDGREDRTAQPYVTIDSPGTQDMDDALMATQRHRRTPSIAIADPTAMIEPGSPAEEEAFNRATAISSRASRCPCCQTPSAPACAH